jgi:nucleotide-binding universal stress UspA family protein
MTGVPRLELGYEGPSVLIVDVDGSDTSWHALHYALGLARRQGSGLVAVFAYTSIVSWNGTVSVVERTGDELAAELNEAVMALAEEHHVAAEFLRTQRDPVLYLLEVASARCADAIIVGASRALSQRLFGSKAARTIRRGRCPVIVVP